MLVIANKLGFSTISLIWAVVSEKVNVVSPVVRPARSEKEVSRFEHTNETKSKYIVSSEKQEKLEKNGAEKLATSEQLLCSFIRKESI
jgi:hypothetical protein